MKNTVLIDANVALDFVITRENSHFARELFQRCAKKQVRGFIALHTLSIIWYVLRKDARRRDYLKALCAVLQVAGAGQEAVLRAIDNVEFDDFEDCLQVCCAADVGAEYIITRNVRDFRISEIPALLPEDYLRLLDG